MRHQNDNGQTVNVMRFERKIPFEGVEAKIFIEHGIFARLRGLRYAQYIKI